MASAPNDERRLAALVLGCAAPPYDETIDAMRQTWGSVEAPEVDVYYVYGIPHGPRARQNLARLIGADDVPEVPPDNLVQFGDVLIAGCADAMRRQVDCLLRKRLLAFDHLTRGGAYDWIYTCCATSYVDPHKLLEYARSLPERPFITGALSIDPKQKTLFASGASMLLTADIAASLARDRTEVIAGNQFDHMDDVTIGHWVASHMGDLTLDEAVRHIIEARPLPADYVFILATRTTRDFVMAPREKHTPAQEAFHYHFHSKKPDDMRHFHTRYLAVQKR